MDTRDKLLYALLLLLAGTLLCYGWKVFWFLTDDAYIAFRYISNWDLGYGPVWNPPPFRPVEGYTNFLWISLLYAAWQLSGIAPPQLANYLSLVFALGALYIASRILLQLPWTSVLFRHRMALLALFLLGVTSNRTFLAWSSSGLETAMLSCFILAWTYAGICLTPSQRRWPLAISTSATLIYLTRPDGLLFIAATLIALFLAWRAGHFPTQRLIQALPLLAAPIHLVWRKSFYGEWLPNTYYAKAVAIWPESGIRYALSFALEYALWTWGTLAIYVLWAKRDTLWRFFTVPYSPAKLIPPLTTLTLLGHATYYTFVFGGDHFEYRIYVHLVPLVYLSFIWLLNVLESKPKQALTLLTLSILLSWPIPWIHWSQTSHLDNRSQTLQLKTPVAPHFPTPLRFYASAFDNLQSWLIDRFVCIRHQEHKTNHRFLANMFPPRSQGQFLPSTDHPVFFFPAIGVPAWRLPHINILDIHGLNDYIIARTPPDPNEQRMMAHERTPPHRLYRLF